MNINIPYRFIDLRIVVRILTLGKKSVLMFVFVGYATVAFAQPGNTGLEEELESMLEFLVADDETKDIEQLLNDLQHLRDHPVNINTADIRDLRSLFFLTPAQAEAIIGHLRKYGNILSVYELAAIDGIDEHTARLLSFFVTVDSPRMMARPKRGSNEFIVRGGRFVEKQAAYKEPKRYEGSPERLYLRWRYSSSAWQAGITADKDAGESFFRASNPEGFDFYSGFVLFNLGVLNASVIAGDYVVRFGQGLVAAQGFSLGKSTGGTQIASFNDGIKPHTSSEENNFMRGVGISFDHGSAGITAFASYNKIDAGTDDVDGEKVITSLRSGGYHRTAGEIAGKNATGVLSAGGNIAYRGNDFSIGLTGIHTLYDHPLARADNEYNRYLFQGASVTNMSLDYRWSANRVFMFGEVAATAGGGLACLAGSMYQPVDKAELAVLYRNIDKRYSGPLSSAFVESSQVNDEEGLYVGVHAALFPKTTFSGYMDFFRFRWIKYTTAGPGKGREFLMNLVYKPDTRWELTARYFNENKPVRATGLYSSKNIGQIKQSLRFNMSYKPGKAVTLRSRVEQSLYRHDHRSSGFYAGQDVGYQPAGSVFSGWVRFAYFNTSDYDSRIYAYENDLLYLFSVPAHYGEGVRMYVTGKVKLCKNADFSYKVAQSRFTGVEAVGSGNSRIEGNARTEVKFQFRVKI